MRQTETHDAAKKTDSRQENIHKKQLHILLIDDDRIQMNLTEAMLKSILDNHQGSSPDIRCCEQPEEVFSLLLSEQFDLVFTDLQMRH